MIPADPVFHKPKSILAARNLVYAGVFIGFVMVLLRDFALDSDKSRTILNNVIDILYLLFIIFLIRQVAMRKNWARIVLVIVYILSLTGIYFVFKPGSGVGFLEATLFIFEQILEIAALIFLFKKESSNWLNEPSAVS